MEDLIIRLSGRHQQLNAACALSCIMILKESGFDIPKEAIMPNLRIPAGPPIRNDMQLILHILLDGAHNPSGAAVLADTIRQYFSDKQIHLIWVFCGIRM